MVSRTKRHTVHARWLFPIWVLFLQPILAWAAQQFGGGKTTAKTLFSLAAFNATVCYAMYDLFKVKPTKIMVRSARSRLGIKIDTKDKTLTTKEKVFNKVFEMHPEFPWEQHKAPTGQHAGEMVYGKVNQDMADAFVIVKGGQKIASIGKIAK